MKKVTKLSKSPFKKARQLEELQMKNARNICGIVLAIFMAIFAGIVWIAEKLGE